MNSLAELTILQTSIQERCDSIAATRDWPCRTGCDRCCRRLAGVPNLTQPEWSPIFEAYGRLPELVQLQIRGRVALLPPDGPMTCPFLDRMAERCLIYEVRPVACRTYGFYRDRDRGLFCREMQAQDERGDWDGVIWGNAAAVEAKLDELDERKDIDAWFASEGA